MDIVRLIEALGRSAAYPGSMESVEIASHLLSKPSRPRSASKLAAAACGQRLLTARKASKLRGLRLQPPPEQRRGAGGQPHAAVRAVQYYPDIKRFYQKKTRQKNPAIARTLVQKEIARAVYVVLEEQVDFNHKFKGQPLSRQKAPQWPRRASPDV